MRVRLYIPKRKCTTFFLRMVCKISHLCNSLMNRVCDLYSEVVILLIDEDYREPESKSPPPAGLQRLNRKMNESVTGRALPHD